MLETVVKDQHIAFQFLDRCFCQVDAIRSGEVRDVGQILFKDQRFVARSPPSTIATAQDRYSMSKTTEIASNEFDARRLSRSPDRQVPHTDDRRGHSFNRLPAAIVEPVANPRAPAVRPTSHAQPAALQSRREAPLPAAQEIQV